MLTPGFDADCIVSYVSHSTPDQPASLVLQLYGAGNAPMHNAEFLAAMKVAHANGAVVVVTSQCLRGSVDMSQYETGSLLLDYGVIDGRDMTVEACVTKLAYLLGRGLRNKQLKIAMETDLRGELSLTQDQEYGKHETNSFDRINSLLSVTAVASAAASANPAQSVNNLNPTSNLYREAATSGNRTAHRVSKL